MQKKKKKEEKRKVGCKVIDLRSTLAKCYLAFDSPRAQKSKLSLRFF